MRTVLTKEHWLIIAKEYGRTKGATELGKELGVSKQRIYQIVQMLRDNGVDIPAMRALGAVDFVKKHLK
jgi:biotin operon repressor